MSILAVLLLSNALAVGLALTAGSAEPHIKAAMQAYREGTAAAKRREYTPAIVSFREAIRIEPTFLDAFHGIIQSCLSAGQQTQAAAAITQLLEIEPDRVKDRILLGQLLLEGKEPQRALAQFSYALNLQPENADALLGFAVAARQAGMQGRSDEAMQKGRLEHPQDARFRK